MEQKYLPLFRKYRPQSFKDIVGQESLVKALSNAIELNRVANAYLFCGPRGTGKTSSARIFAKSLNCEHGPTLEPCQKCASCVDITNATGLDVIEIDAASNRGIQDAKELISQVQYAPINGKYKIFIIDEVHMLTTEAFNVLLKTFEEPPKNVIFILATTEPHKVLETIVSRCQRFDLKRITTDDIIKRLREISNLENIKITDDALFTIAKNVSGGLRDSIALLDQVSILGVKEEIGKDLIEELLGKVNFDVLLNLLEDVNNENIEQAINDVEKIYTKGNEPKNLADNFIEFLRNVILVLNSDNNEIISNCTTLVKEDIDKIRNSGFDKDKIVKILNVLIEYYREIKISTNPYLWMELAIIGACKLNLAAENKKVEVSQISNIKKEIKQPSIPAKPEALAKPQPKEEVKAENIKQETEEKINQANLEKMDGAEIWTNIVQAIPSLPVKAFYSSVAKLVKVEGNKIVLGFLNDTVFAQAKLESKMNLLKGAIDSVCKGYYTECIRINQDTPTVAVKPKISASKPQTSQGLQQKSTVQASKNPIKQENVEQPMQKTKVQYGAKVQEMIEQFDGRIIE